MLSCDNITATHWGVTLFKGLGFTLMPGSLLMVRGMRTQSQMLLNIMSGQRAPRSGEVRFDGEPIKGNVNYPTQMLHIGVHNPFHPRLTVEEDLQRFFLPNSTDALAQAAMRYFGLTEYAQTPCGALPKRLKSRVALARLLASPCPLWLLDHPDSTLDEDGKALLYALIANRCNQDGIVVIATKAQNFVRPCLPLELQDFK